MANLQETAQWEATINEIAVTDPVVGGANGPANVQATQLANRTAYLKSIVDPLAAAETVAQHKAAADPHPQYLTQAEGDALYDALGAVTTHEAAADPHPQYLTQAEGDALYDALGAVTTHEVAADPHPQYLTQAEGDALYDALGAVTTHEVAADPHPQYLTQPEADALYPQLGLTATLDANGNVVQPAGLGVNQTWQDVTAGRVFNTTYTNQTSRPIALSIALTCDNSGSSRVSVNLTIDGIIAQTVSITESQGTLWFGTMASVFSIIPPNSTYSINLVNQTGVPSITTWAELR